MSYWIGFSVVVSLLVLIAIGLRAVPEPASKKNFLLGFLVTLGFALVIFAGLRDSKVDRDYPVYVERFQCLTKSAVDWDDNFCQVEPSFVMLANAAAFIGWETAAVIFLYALIGVSTKLIAFYHSPQPLMSVVMYLSPWFLLHEMTQIKAGAAAGFGLISLICLSRHRHAWFLATLALGAFFHYAAFIYLLLPLLGLQRHRSALGLVLLAGSVAFSLIDITKLIPALTPLVLGSRYEAYVQLPGGDELSQRFGVFKLISIATYLAGVRCQPWVEGEAKKRLFSLCLSGVLLANCFFYAFYSFPNISIRLWEMFLVPSILLVPMMAAMVRPRAIGWIAVIGIPVLYLYYYLTQTDVFSAYAISI